MKKLLPMMLLCGALALCGDETFTFKPDMVKTKNGKVESFMDEDGMNSVRLSRMLNSTGKGNEYIDCEIRLPQTVDLTGKALVVRVQTDTPDVLKGFYVRAYNGGEKKPALSFNIWKPLLVENYLDVIVIPGKDGQMLWEGKVVSGTEPNRIDRLSFHAGSNVRGKEMTFRIKSVKVIESPFAALEKFFAPVGKFNTRIPTFLGPKTQVAVENGVLKLSGRSPKTSLKPNANLYQGACFAFAAPVDGTGKKICFEYRVIGPVGLVFFRGTEKKIEKGCWSYSTNRVARDWQKIELPLAPGAQVNGFKHEAEFNGDLTKFQVFSIYFATVKLDTDIAIEVRDLSFQ